jgi:WD40 repeat protein
VTSVAVHDRKIVFGSSDKTIRVWDMATMKTICNPLRGHTNDVVSVAVNNEKIVSAESYDNTIKVWTW